MQAGADLPARMKFVADGLRKANGALLFCDPPPPLPPLPPILYILQSLQGSST